MVPGWIQGRVQGDFWKFELLSCCQNFIFDDKMLKYKYIVDSNPLMTFLKRNLKKMVPGWIQGWVLGEFGWISRKLNNFPEISQTPPKPSSTINVGRVTTVITFIVYSFVLCVPGWDFFSVLATQSETFNVPSRTHNSKLYLRISMIDVTYHQYQI